LSRHGKRSWGVDGGGNIRGAKGNLPDSDVQKTTNFDPEFTQTDLKESNATPSGNILSSEVYHPSKFERTLPECNQPSRRMETSTLNESYDNECCADGARSVSSEEETYD